MGGGIKHLTNCWLHIGSHTGRVERNKQKWLHSRSRTTLSIHNLTSMHHWLGLLSMNRLWSRLTLFNDFSQVIWRLVTACAAACQGGRVDQKNHLNKTNYS
uniref:Uncharacterized protein LOC104266651 n=1 Tax=Phallusia mammillata TaxID=59560 RepID=A0A6F9DID8_9ASCI|nr:uncharacterized protein LOC104266651 [Phallusia mammillata]